MSTDPKQPLRVNLNTSVKVKLTKSGQDFFDKHPYKRCLPDSEGFIHMLLWEAMNIFGPETKLLHSTPFEENVIYLNEIR